MGRAGRRALYRATLRKRAPTPKAEPRTLYYTCRSCGAAKEFQLLAGDPLRVLPCDGCGSGVLILKDGGLPFGPKEGTT